MNTPTNTMPPTSTSIDTPTTSPTTTVVPTSTASVAPTATGTAVAALAATPFTVTVGQTLTVTGTNFAAGETVSFFWDRVVAPALTATTATAGGAVTGTIVAPASTSGLHTLIAYGATSHRAAGVPVAIKAQLTITPGSTSPGAPVYVSGGGFGPSETITIQTGVGAVLGTTTSDGVGNVVPLTLTISPTSPLGTFWIKAVGTISKVEAYYRFTIIS